MTATRSGADRAQGIKVAMPTLRMLPVCVLAAVLLWHSPARVAGQSSGPPRLLPNPNPSSFISDAPVNFNVTCNPFFQVWNA